MKSLRSGATTDLLLLSLAAGSADAAGYLGLGRVFTSNMTGNVILLGIALGREQAGDTVRAALVLLTFALGAFGGFWLARSIGERDWPALAVRVLGWEAALLVVFALLWSLFPMPVKTLPSYGYLILLSLAMGLQSAAMNQLRAPGVAATAITGTLTALMSSAVKLFAPIRGSEQASDLRMTGGFQFLFLCLYGIGAVVNGLLVTAGSRLIGILPAVCVLAIVVRQAFPKQEGSSP